jgi:hypothetical protein
VKFTGAKISEFFVALFNLFTNPVLLLFTETILASFFVVFVDPTWWVLPIMFWIFMNFSPKINSVEAINWKIGLLLLPLIVTCTQYKIEYHKDRNSTSNPDFNFAEEETKNLVFSIIGVIIISVVILELSAQNMLRRGLKIGSEDGSSKPSASHKSLVSIPYWIKYLIDIYMSNSIFFIAINIYVISININVLNYVLMIFMLKLLLSGLKSKKTIILIYFANVITLFTRYLFVIG